MNVLSGLNITGLTLNTEENFNSIPSLWQWNDARDRVELQDGNVRLWGDKSTQGNNLIQNYVTKQPAYENGLWISSGNINEYLKSNRSDYAFLHNGSKFGVYGLMKTTMSLATPTHCTGLMRTAFNAGTGFQYLIGSNGDMGRMAATIRGGATAPTKTISNLLKPASPNYSASDTIQTTSIVNFGQTLGTKLTYGNATLNSTPFFNTLAEYPTIGNTSFTVCVGIDNIIIRAGMLLIYNWNGYSDAEVQAFDSTVMELLNKEKLIFENLDI